MLLHQLSLAELVFSVEKEQYSGTFSGVLLIAVLRNGLNLLNVNADIQTVVIGAVIIIAVFIDVVRSGAFTSVRRKRKAQT